MSALSFKSAQSERELRRIGEVLQDADKERDNLLRELGRVPESVCDKLKKKLRATRLFTNQSIWQLLSLHHFAPFCKMILPFHDTK